MGYIQFKAQKVILLIRNPFDAIESYFNMGMTNTHNKTLTRSVIILYHLIYLTRCIFLTKSTKFHLKG